MKKQEWIVDVTSAGERLDVFLTSVLPEETRSQISKAIKNEEIQLNGAVPTVHAFLKAGDTIVWDKSIRSSKLKAQSSLPIPNIPIIEESDDWIIINKPSGIVAHPDAKHPSGTVVDAMLQHDPRLARVGEDPARPGIVHRLDMEASGLMVVAKNQASFENIKRQFKSHSIEKKYLALVYGEVSQDEDDIKLRIGRSASRPRMAAHPVNEKTIGKAAWTHYRVLKRLKNATLVEAEPLSGRTHQLRAHFFALGHPIIGDPLYKPHVKPTGIDATRLMLQSIHLGFRDLETNEMKRFDLAPDPAFDELMEKIISEGQVARERNDVSNRK